MRPTDLQHGGAVASAPMLQHVCAGLTMSAPTFNVAGAAGWEVKEQVAIAAMDCAANRFAFQLVEAIRNEFPSSKRADRLTVRRPVASLALTLILM